MADQFNILDTPHAHTGTYVLDPGFPMTYDPRFGGSATSIGGANMGRYSRTLTGGTISKIALVVGNQAGNISVAVYAATGSVRSAVPATRLATSGSVVCPATGYQEVALGGSVVVPAGSFLFISSDDLAATFVCFSAANDSRSDGLAYTQASAHPAPATAIPANTSLRNYLLIGVA